MTKFLWGVASAAHQVEGGNIYSDWHEWEKEGKIKTGDSAVVACDHYNRYKEDFKLIKFLNNNAYRFSVEWSRIEKNEGEFDEKEIEHYVDMLKALKEMEIEPILTLHHFTIPLWLYSKGGLLNENFHSYFARFVKKVVPYFAPYVNYWITINEPVVLGMFAYIVGEWPPGHHSMKEGFSAIRELLLSHLEAYKIIKEEKTSSQVSIANNMTIFEPFNKFNPLDVTVNNQIKYMFNYTLLDSIFAGKMLKPLGKGEPIPLLKDSLDFIGLNYYSRVFIKFSPKNMYEAVNKGELSDFNNEIYPEGIYTLLTDLKKRYGKSIMITENGIADHLDKWRPKLIQDTVGYLRKAKNSGVDILGYMHWSLMDNFEWAEGYSMRFGLYEVDFKTLERKPRKSAFVYKDIAQNEL
ncbi:MAG: glycoside hydrolase family 1 protein [Caldisericaceae bacterium]